jgi:putative endonuclease
VPEQRHAATSPRTRAQVAGDAAEALVARRLSTGGWTILGSNVHVGRGELDLVAIDPGPPAELVIVEVRWRASRAFGLPEESVDWRKRRHLRKAGFGLVEIGRLPDGRPVPRLPLRFDLVLVEPATAGESESRIRHHRHVLGA